MATVFISHSSDDRDLALRLEQKLQGKGHTFRIGVTTPPAGKWRLRLAAALRASDAVIPLLSKAGLNSNFVASEVGAARAFDETRKTLLLPVLIEIDELPDFVADYHSFFLSSRAERDLNRLAEALDLAIAQHIDAAPATPRVFISHRHADSPIAEALVGLLEAAFHVTQSDVRCTSVQPYTLAPGDRTSERLRSEIGGAEVVLGLISPDTDESDYVLAELGAAWGLDVATFPLLARGSHKSDVPAPLNERHSLSLEDRTQCDQLVTEVGRVTTLRKKEGVEGRISRQAGLLVDAAKGADAR